MLLLLPIRAESPVRRFPLVNYSILAVNVLVYLMTDWLSAAPPLGALADVKEWAMLQPAHLQFSQFFAYQFVHGDVVHLLGNMWFLWVFGNGVNAKMGNLPYVLFYLAGGVFAGVAFAVGGEHPCIGASGAIAGVTTAYLVLFPRSAITVFYWLWLYVGTMHWQAVWLIGLKIILWDNIISPKLAPEGGFVQVAYSAHIAGYVFGFVCCGLMLLLRALPRDQYDIIALARRAYQRHQFKLAMADPDAAARASYGRVARPVREVESEPVQPVVIDEVSCLKGEISDLLRARDYAAAAQKYELFLTRDPDQCLPRRNQLDIANQLMTMNRYPQAAAAYEKYLKAYPADSEGEQVRLILGIIYAKYLQQYGAAQKYLRECLSRLTNPDQRSQANHWLDAATQALGRGPSPA